MLSTFVLACSILAQSNNPSASPTIRRVDVEGNFRYSDRTIRAWLSEAPGKAFTPMKARADLERLNRLGLFQNVEIESRNVAPGSVDLVYRVRELPLVSTFSIIGVNDAMEDLISRELHKQKLEIRPGTPCSPARMRKVTEAVRRMIMARKHPLAEVEVKREQHGNQVQITLHVRPGPGIGIGVVQFEGNKAIPKRELLSRMGKSRPASLVTKWSGAGSYMPDELAQGLEAVRQLYRSRGYAAVAIGKPDVVTRAFPGRRDFLIPWRSSWPQKIAVRVAITEGSLYLARSVRVEGDTKAAASDVSGFLRKLQIPGRYDNEALESTRRKILAALGHRGYALAQVELDQQFDAAAPAVDVIYRVSAGNPVLIGRIDFAGNMRLPDKFLRRELRVREGDVYDSSRLDESLRRLNRSGLIQNLSRDDVSLKSNPERNSLDLVFKVREKDRHGIFGTGGTGGVAGGYLGAIYTAFNLLGLGEKLSFELDGGSAQSNALLDLAMNHFMGGPFSLGLSFAHRVTGFNASNIVPGPQQAVSFLRMRTTAGAVQGTYHVSPRIGVGLGFQVERDSILTDDSTAGSGTWKTTPRSTLQPSFFFDSTCGEEHPGRGFMMSVTPAWSAPTPFSAMDTMQQSARLRIYRQDPLSGGRNAIAFQLIGILSRPLGGGGLPLERRLFPADEVLRGFAHGSISPWLYDPSAQDEGQQLQPAGADTVFGFSSEYRVPIYGALSGAGFLDLGWVGLSGRSLEGRGSTTGVLEETNHLLRASTGGELRLLIPGLHQPVRLIFAWNPLRLHTLLTSASGARSLTDPSRSIRFALGNVF